MVDLLGEKMQKIYFSQTFIFGLYTYLRQIDLSLDRVLYDSWDKFLLFYEDKISHKKVLEYIENQCKDKVELFNKSNPEKPDLPFFRRFLSIYNKVIYGKPYLYDFEIAYLYSVIKKISRFISSEHTPNKEQIIELRMELIPYDSILSLKLNKNEIDRAHSIEHFNQSDFIAFSSLKTIVGENWLGN